MKSGLENRNNSMFDISSNSLEHVSMKSGLEDRNNAVAAEDLREIPNQSQ